MKPGLGELHLIKNMFLFFIPAKIFSSTIFLLRNFIFHNFSLPQFFVFTIFPFCTNLFSTIFPSSTIFFPPQFFSFHNFSILRHILHPQSFRTDTRKVQNFSFHLIHPKSFKRHFKTGIAENKIWTTFLCALLENLLLPWNLLDNLCQTLYFKMCTKCYQHHHSWQSSLLVQELNLSVNTGKV